MSSPAVRFAQILIIRRTVRILLGPLFSADENPTQTGQLPHVAEQGEQAQEKDEALVDGDLEFRPLRDKHKAENGSWEHVDHARQNQNSVAEQSVLELLQRRTNAIRDPIADLHQRD
jgi:hypothetical protein